MKLQSDLIVFDLEATVSFTPEGIQEHRNIIQVGAVYLKKDDHNKYHLVDRFDALVKPHGETVSPFITELTGISNEMVETAPHFNVVGDDFRKWAMKHGNIKRARLCAWGTHFDLPLLRRGYEAWNMDYPFTGGGYDIKSWAVLWMMLNGRSEKMGIQEAGKVMGLPFEGKLHNALADAEYTARIALHLLHDLEQNYSAKIIGLCPESGNFL